MKRVGLLALVLTLIGLSGSVSLAVTIDFESFTPGAVVSGPGVFADLVFSYDGTGYLGVRGENPGPLFGGSKCVIGEPYMDSTRYRADFLIGGVEAVSVVMGDYGMDQDNLFLSAYNSSNALVDADAFVLPAGVGGGATLSVVGSNIAYVLYGSTNTSGYENAMSVYFDNFSYRSCDPNIPEPMSVMLGIMGLGSIVGFRRLRK
jgi:hypothetical protein